MTLKELHHLCLANGVPPLLYKWSFSKEIENELLKKKLTPIFDNIDSFIRGRNVWYIFMADSVLASRIGVSFLKAAYLSGFMGSMFTNPVSIAAYNKETWYDENGDVYSTILNSDFLVVDKVHHKLEPFEKKIWDKFVEDRLLMQRSTIFVGLVSYTRQGVFDGRAADLLKTLDAKILTEEGTEDLC